MRDDDTELVDLLCEVLDEAPPQPPASRVAALRARAGAARQKTLHPHGGHSGWLAAAAVALAVLGGVAAGRLLDGGESSPSAAGEVEYDGVLHAPSGEPAAARLTVVQTGVGRVVELDTEVLPILPAGELYEVWFVGSPGEGQAPPRISAGTFHPDPAGRSHVRLAAAVDPARYPTVEITAEPGDGDPAATGPVVLRSTIGT